jgi:glucokinase
VGETHTLGIDLGGTQLRAALVSKAGEVLKRAAVATDVAGGPIAVVAQMQKLANDVGFSELALSIKAVGVSAPGPLDSDTGTIIDIPTLPGWAGFPLRRMLGDKFLRPVALENDGIAAAYGEWKFGAGQGFANLVYVTVSTGIGGGVVMDGRLMRGHRGMAGHVGHMMIAREGPACACGGVGCFEALASGTAFGQAGRAKGFESGEAIVAAARNGDATALELVAGEADYLGYGFASLLHLYSPQRLIMGGGVSRALDLMLPQIRAQITQTAMPPFRTVELVPAMLGDNSGLVGAAGLAALDTPAP